ncbi:MAG: hypothetical protein OEL85_09940, partial [Desulfobulbaceae bacterium]|nr:hypothetical protein [Desulfobulbaceae bacterium]
ECQLCKRKVEQFKDELQEIGETAMLSVPLLTKNITLPPEEVVRASHKSSWLPSFGAAVMAGLVLFVYFLGMETPMSPRFIALQGPDTPMEDEYLMEEIFEMVENPLSDALYQITGDNGDFDDDFLEFVVPDIQEDFQSNNFIEGGIKQC